MTWECGYKLGKLSVYHVGDDVDGTERGMFDRCMEAERAIADLIPDVPWHIKAKIYAHVHGLFGALDFTVTTGEQSEESKAWWDGLEARCAKDAELNAELAAKRAAAGK